MNTIKNRVHEILDGYDTSNITIATLCSHTSLQIFHGAKKEGFRTLGIALREPPKFYDAFPLAKPDEFLCLDDYSDIKNKLDELVEKNTIIIPHGSFVEYVGPKDFKSLKIPTFGNRSVLEWESDRSMERIWLEKAGLSMPKEIKNPKDIKMPVIVKYHGAKGGRGFFIAKDYHEFERGVDRRRKYSIQEYIMGTRYYIHYFYSPIKNDGYRLSKGSLQILGVDRRDEANIDEMYKLGSQKELKSYGIYPSFVVTGNVPVVLRESLLPKAFAMGEKVVESSWGIMGGLKGSFCLETVVTDKLEFRVFEISARIVAGTNVFVNSSPYADYIEGGLSMGRRIAKEIKYAAETGQLKEIIS